MFYPVNHDNHNSILNVFARKQMLHQSFLLEFQPHRSNLALRKSSRLFLGLLALVVSRIGIHHANASADLKRKVTHQHKNTIFVF